MLFLRIQRLQGETLLCHINPSEVAAGKLKHTEEGDPLLSSHQSSSTHSALPCAGIYWISTQE